MASNLTSSLFFFDPAVASTKWTLEQLKAITAGQSILDAGAGECRFKEYCSHLKYVGQDFAQYNGEGDSVGLQTKKWDNSKLDIVSDIMNIPVADKSFDNILCTEVFEHIPLPEQAVKEFSRILRPGGRLIITAPFASQTHFAPYHFATGFSIYWYREILKMHNFTILKAEANGNYFDNIAFELIRLPMVAKRYSFFGPLALLLYVVTFPVAMLFYCLSFLSRGSEEQLTFGYHVLAEKL